MKFHLRPVSVHRARVDMRMGLASIRGTRGIWIVIVGAAGGKLLYLSYAGKLEAAFALNLVCLIKS